jgi:hypothetical protein
MPKKQSDQSKDIEKLIKKIETKIKMLTFMVDGGKMVVPINNKQLISLIDLMEQARYKIIAFEAAKKIEDYVYKNYPEIALGSMRNL